MSEKELIKQAIKAREMSYSPYSGFKVGAALLSKSGKIYLGANIENAAFSPSICAERVAIDCAIMDGEKIFDSIAIVGGDKGSFAFPCGVCRQVMAEFSPKLKIVVATDENNFKTFFLSDLLPHSFDGDGIKK
ncbi:MAG: cytidine deaminase [Clostridia bacterium]